MELKAHRIDNIISAYKIGKAFCMKTEEEVYFKSQADKVIAEKDAEIAQLQAMLEERNKQVGELKKACNDKDDWCLHTLKENRHHKYKRCLAMAKWCYSMDCRMLNEAADHGTYFRDSWCWKRASWYGKWKRKWLELAEEFNEAK